MQSWNWWHCILIVVEMSGDFETLPQQEVHEFKVIRDYIQGSGGGGGRWGGMIGRKEKEGNREGKDKAISWWARWCLYWRVLTVKLFNWVLGSKHQKRFAFPPEKVHPVTCYHSKWQAQKKMKGFLKYNLITTTAYPFPLPPCGFITDHLLLQLMQTTLTAEACLLAADIYKQGLYTLSQFSQTKRSQRTVWVFTINTERCTPCKCHWLSARTTGRGVDQNVSQHSQGCCLPTGLVCKQSEAGRNVIQVPWNMLRK